ncbi:MAG: AAA family ATPase [Deltaproteobacteria bacterium]|nr:AAA family ATPase [Deltaproteobacteria bacterium]
MKCIHCRYENQLPAKFCSNCGRLLKDSLGQTSADELSLSLPEKPPSPQYLVHSPSLKPANDSLAGERKYITALCSDLSGYTAMCEKLDPEEVKGIMRQIFGDITRVVAGYDAFIEKYIGDAVMALFGVPKAHEDDPVRALEAAREIHQLVVACSPRLQERIGHKLSMKTGIYTGLVVTGEIDLYRGTHGVAGGPLNRASRLCGLAQPGEILVGRDTYCRAREHFSFQDLGGYKIKGVAESVQVYKVISSRPQVGMMLMADVQEDSFVGRELELIQLKEMFNRVYERQEGGIVFITGNAGVGKSRLLAEVKRRFSTTEMRWLQGRSLSYGQLISYWPFMEIIRRFAGITAEDHELAAWDKLLHHIYELFHDETAEILPYLASLMTLAVPGEYQQRVEFLDGEAMGRQIMRAMWRFFERLVQRQPLILVFEDLHWTDRSSLELLEHLSPLVKDYPLFICLLSRPEIEGPQMGLRHHFAAEYAHQYHEMMLSPLSPSESVDLMGSLLQCEKLPRQVRELIYEKAAGNPLFIEEVVQSLKEMGAVVQEGKSCRWDFLPQFDELMISGTIRGLITARIDRLHDEVKQVLKIAAVIGRNFFYRVLQAIDEADPALDASLERLQQIDLIREKRQIPELEYMFKHDLTQEAAYESILIQRRVELHRKVGEIIEVLFHDRLEEFYGLLSYHYSRGEEWEKAQYYLFKAADQAGKIAADSEALDHYKKALTVYEQVYGRENSGGFGSFGSLQKGFDRL